MTERHTRGRDGQYWRETTDTGGTRSAAARASDARPFKPYVHPGDDEPPAVTAARERHRALNAKLAERLRELEARQDGAT